MASKPQQYTATITKKLQLTKTVYHFFIDVENPARFTFVPGQYGTFIIDSKTRRQYTFCSAPHPSKFELVVDVSPMGVGSKYFLEKKEGDRVEFLAPFGDFTLSENSLKKIFIATGSGIAPFRSMLFEKVHSLSFMVHSKDKNESTSMNHQQQTTNCSLYWGLRYEDDVYWNSEFQALAGQLVGFQYFLCLSKPGEKWEEEVRLRPSTSSGLWRGKGHVTDYVFKNEKNLQNCEFYLCGNNAMIEEMERRLSAQNIKKEQIKIDQFYL